MAVAYIDYSSMEFLIAAALSDGHCGPNNPMLEMYQSGDPYLSFAKRVDAAPEWATKKTHEQLRDRYKVGLLAIQYGMQAEGLAMRIGTSSFEAHEMLSQHHELFAQYWQWSDDWVGRSVAERCDVRRFSAGSAAPASSSSTSARSAISQCRPMARRFCASLAS